MNGGSNGGIPPGFNGGINGGMSGSLMGSLSGEESESRDRKRRDRDCLEDEETGSKRLKGEEDELHHLAPPSYYPGGELLPVVEGSLPAAHTSLPPAHPTWPGCLMPPPTHPPTQVTRVYYSYFDQRHKDESFEDEDNVVEE